MATAIKTLTDDWSLIVAAGDEFLVTIPRDAQHHVEIATSDDTDPPAAANGHLLRIDIPESMNRALIGPGAVYARTPSGTGRLVVNAWTP